MGIKINTKETFWWILSAMLFVGVWLFFWQVHPEWLSFQEQNQLFLCTDDYLFERWSVAGGIADWLGEFIVQFFYVEWLGALLMALLLLLMQRMGCLAFVWKGKGHYSSLISHFTFLLSFLPPLFFLWLFGDENVLVAMPVAVTLLLAAVALLRRTRWLWWWLIILPSLWSVGQCSQRIGPQWTNFYRIPQRGPSLSGWETEKWELLKQDYLIRNERWTDVLKRAKDRTVTTPFWSNSVNLSLAMTGQLASRQFEYWQSGEDALIMPMVRDNVSNLPTMEAFWRLGMVNSALRYASDIQESILNARKSGRLEKRIIECLIVNGQYTIARKHLALLKKTFFYRSWAEDAERLLDHEDQIAAHPVWGRLRQLRYKQNFLYSYAEIDKMLGILFQNNTQNKMALEYFLSQLLLKGDAQTFMQALPWAQQYGDYPQMPQCYEDAVVCMRTQPVPDSPYGRYVKRMLGGH